MKPSKVVSGRGKYKLDAELALVRADRRCEALPNTKDRCSSPATDVVYEGERGKYIAMCKPCRLAGVGSSAAEKSVKTKSLRRRQTEIQFPEPDGDK